MIIDEQTRRKLRLMGADHLLDALERQDERACAGMTTGERVALAVDDAYNVWADRKITAMAKRCLWSDIGGRCRHLFWTVVAFIVDGNGGGWH